MRPRDQKHPGLGKYTDLGAAESLGSPGTAETSQCAASTYRTVTLLSALAFII
jgi:hypothetical protein